MVAGAPWHALFAQTLVVGPDRVDLERFAPGFTVVACGELEADAAPDGGPDPSPGFIGISFARRLVIVLGSTYGAEIKKALLTVMNQLMPDRVVLPLHCAANIGRKGDVAPYFGLSGRAGRH